MGQLVAGMNTSLTVSVIAQHKDDEHDKVTLSFSTRKGCLPLQFLQGSGKKWLRNPMTNIKENGLTPRVHGNSIRRLKHALSLSSAKYIIQFLLSYTEHALLLGRVPEYRLIDLQLLPSSVKKRAV